MKYEFYFKIQATRIGEHNSKVYVMPEIVLINIFPWGMIMGYAIRECMIYKDLIKI